MGHDRAGGHTHTHTNLKAQQSELQVQVDTDSEVFLAGLARVVLCDFTALVLNTQHTVPSVPEPVSATPRLLCDSNVYAKSSALTEM